MLYFANGNVVSRPFLRDNNSFHSDEREKSCKNAIFAQKHKLEKMHGEGILLNLLIPDQPQLKPTNFFKISLFQK
jgi:hypothetical protein